MFDAMMSYAAMHLPHRFRTLQSLDIEPQPK